MVGIEQAIYEQLAEWRLSYRSDPTHVLLHPKTVHELRTSSRYIVEPPRVELGPLASTIFGLAITVCDWLPEGIAIVTDTEPVPEKREYTIPDSWYKSISGTFTAPSFRWDTATTSGDLTYRVSDTSVTSEGVTFKATPYITDVSGFGETSKTYITSWDLGTIPAEPTPKKAKKESKPIEVAHNPDSIYGRALEKYRK